MDHMDYRERSWRPPQRKVVKLLKKALGTLSRMFSSSAAPALAAPVQRRDHNDLAFMTCILKVKCSRQGWQRSVLAVLKNCKGVQFQMDGEGMVEVNAMVDADKVLRRIGRSTKLELQWIQFGQCSSNLFMPQTTTQNNTPPPLPLHQNPPYPYPYPNPNPNPNPYPYPHPHPHPHPYPYPYPYPPLHLY